MEMAMESASGTDMYLRTMARQSRLGPQTRITTAQWRASHASGRRPGSPQGEGRRGAQGRGGGWPGWGGVSGRGFQVCSWFGGHVKVEEEMRVEFRDSQMWRCLA